MNEVRNRKLRTDRKRTLRDFNRAGMDRSSSPLAVETPVTRPSRVCSSRRQLPNVSDGFAAFVSLPTSPLPRTSLKAWSDYACLAKRPPSRPSASRTTVRAVSLAVITSVPKEHLELRSLWEMAAVLNFFCVFRHIINNLPEFTMDELESALLNPNSVLDTIHVILLKGVPPAARVPLRGDTWPTVLSKKFKDWWWRVAKGPCPLVPCQGAELATYLDLDAPTRVRVLLALCEMRVDQDDARLYIDDSAKRNQLPAVVRKDRSGCGAQGTTFWLVEDPRMGQRLYREGQGMIPAPPSKNKSSGWGRGRNVPPPVPGSWETVATNFEEFREVSTRLLQSRNRLETAMGKKLMQSLMPQLEESQKKKDRMVKKQQREVVLLDTMLRGNGLEGGRSRRERKPVTHTFDEFDRSISEAIKFTKKNVSETLLKHGHGNGVNEVGGLRQERNGNAVHGQFRYANGGSVGVRRSKRIPRSHPAPETDDAGLYSPLLESNLGFIDDDIEGEAVYDDDYLAARQPERSYSARGESFRGDDGNGTDFDEDGNSEKDGAEGDEYKGNPKGGDSDGLGREGRVRRRPRWGPKVRLVNDISCEGARRKVKAVFNRIRGTGGSDFDEQIVRYAQQRLAEGGRGVGQKGGRAESSAQGLGQSRRGTVDIGFEEGSDRHEANGSSFDIRNGKRGGLVEVKRGSGRVLPMEDDAEFIDPSWEQLVQ